MTNSDYGNKYNNYIYILTCINMQRFSISIVTVASVNQGSINVIEGMVFTFLIEEEELLSFQ